MDVFTVDVIVIVGVLTAAAGIELREQLGMYDDDVLVDGFTIKSSGDMMLTSS